MLVDPTFKDTPYQIRNHERYYTYFKDFVGAINGTHVKIIVMLNIKFLTPIGKGTQQLM